MEKQKSLEFLNKCCEEIKGMSQEEFEKKYEEMIKIYPEVENWQVAGIDEDLSDFKIII